MNNVPDAGWHEFRDMKIFEFSSLLDQTNTNRSKPPSPITVCSTDQYEAHQQGSTDHQILYIYEQNPL